MNQQQQQKPRSTAWRHLFSIFLADAMSKTVVAPLERVKLLLQIQPLLKLDQNQQYTSTRSALNRIYLYQGFGAFWRGNWANIFRVIPTLLMRFTLYNKMKSITQDQLSGRLIAGTTTGMLGLFLHYPWDVIRIRLACDMTLFNSSRQYSSIMDCGKKLFRMEGLKGLYKGLFVAQLGVAPYVGLTLTSYDTLLDMYPRETFSNTLHDEVIRVIGIGTISGMIASSVTYPLDTLRRRMQMNGGVGSQRLYIGVKDCIQKMIKNEGVFGFYKGFVVNLIKIVPAVTTQFALYDYLKELTLE